MERGGKEQEREIEREEERDRAIDTECQKEADQAENVVIGCRIER